MATEFVTIKHPDMEGTGTSSRKAFEEVWKEKGFELVEDEGEQAAGEQRQVSRRSSTSQRNEKQGEQNES